jgi:hypothetical protein
VKQQQTNLAIPSLAIIPHLVSNNHPASATRQHPATETDSTKTHPPHIQLPSTTHLPEIPKEEPTCQLAEQRENVLLAKARRDLIKIRELLMGMYSLSVTTRLFLC